MGTAGWTMNAVEWATGLMSPVVTEIPDNANDITNWTSDIATSIMESVEFIEQKNSNQVIYEKTIKDCANAAMQKGATKFPQVTLESWKKKCTEAYESTIKHGKSLSKEALVNLIPGAGIVKGIKKCYEWIGKKKAASKAECLQEMAGFAATLDPTGIISFAKEIYMEKCDYSDN